MRRNLVGIFLFIIFISFVTSDILSINSGGDEEIIVNPENYLEGFFFQEDIAPEMSNVILYSVPFSTNTTNENLTVDYTSTDSDGDVLTNISDWREGGVSIAILNMPFDRQIGSIASGAVRDYSIFGNNATLGGGNILKIPTWNSSCQVGGCYDFDGINDFINGEGPIDVEGKNFTMSGWIWEDADTPSNWAGPLIIGNSYQVGRHLTANRFITMNTTSSIISLSIGAPTRQWNYLVVTHNVDAKNLTTYLNGNPVDSEIYVGDLVSTNQKFAIGSRVQTGTSTLFEGFIDEVMVYNRALTVEQIRANYQAGLAGHQIEIIVSQETEIGDKWQVAMTANDRFFDSTTILSYNLTIENNAPEDPNPLLVSLNGRNETDSDLNCSFDVIDYDSYYIDVTVNWLKNNISQMNLSYYDIANNTPYYSILDKNNLTLGDIWKCSVRYYDGYEYSSWRNSNQLEIIDITPPNITIISPQPINYSELNVTFNVSLSENGSVCYYDLDDWGNLSMIKLNETYFWILNDSLGPGEHNITFWCNDSSNNWGMNFTNFTIENEAAISIELSEKLKWSVFWNVSSLPIDDFDAEGNNGTNATDYYINVSATNTLVDIYVKADGDLHTIGLEVLDLENENYTISLTDPNVTGVSKATMTTDYVIIVGGIGDNSTVYMKFYLDAPAAQGAGMYFNNLDFKAVRHGQAP